MLFLLNCYIDPSTPSTSKEVETGNLQCLPAAAIPRSPTTRSRSHSATSRQSKRQLGNYIYTFFILVLTKSFYKDGPQLVLCAT